MVAITVILAAVIGTFVLGLGQDVSQAAPNAQIELAEATDDDTNFTVNHNGGDSIDFDDITVLVGGSTAETDGDPGELTAGESGEIELDEKPESGTVEVQLRHDPSDSIIATDEVIINEST